MLSIVHKGWRRRTGSMLAAFYLLALAAPVSTVAFSADPSHAHCLDEIHAVASHHHSDDADADHSAPADQTPDQGQNCCGLFGVTALAPSFDITSVPMVVATAMAFTPSEDLFGRGFDRIDRPPRASLSL
jgi:hypothetical protein